MHIQVYSTSYFYMNTKEYGLSTSSAEDAP